jgi:ribulose-5-phosphate 4-epimerase/fuculose-1-phosphate aldolase
MSKLDHLIDELVTANHILAAEDIVDGFGHVSVRHPKDPTKFLISRARSPEVVTHDDIMPLSLDGTPEPGDTRKPYLERFIHGAIYERRPDVMAVVHSHSRSVVPFGITGEPLRPVVHSCATIGHEVPVWDAQDEFGDTNLLVSDMAMGRSMAVTVGAGSSVLMRGHGSTVTGRSLQEVVYTAYYLEVNANLQLSASRLNGRPIKFLTKGEVDLIISRISDGKPGEGFVRAWEYWARRAKAAQKAAG